MNFIYTNRIYSYIYFHKNKYMYIYNPIVVSILLLCDNRCAYVSRNKMDTVSDNRHIKCPFYLNG